MRHGRSSDNPSTGRVRTRACALAAVALGAIGINNYDAPTGAPFTIKATVTG
jgi:hypothetical protein